MFVTYHPMKSTGKQECSGSTVTIHRKLKDNTYKVSGYNHDGVHVHWVASVCELKGFPRND